MAELLAPSYFSQHSRLFLICVSVMECRRPDADSPHTHTHSPHEFFRVVCVCVRRCWPCCTRPTPSRCRWGGGFYTHITHLASMIDTTISRHCIHHTAIVQYDYDVITASLCILNSLRFKWIMLLDWIHQCFSVSLAVVTLLDRHPASFRLLSLSLVSLSLSGVYTAAAE